MSPYETLHVDGMIDGTPVRYTFAVHRGTPPDVAKREAHAILSRSDLGGEMEGVAVQYPAGPYTDALDPNLPPLGAAVVSQPPRPQAGGPAPAVPGLSALPGAPTKPPAADPQKDLRTFLGAWAAKHQLTGAEYYCLLAGALSAHASSLLQLERTNPRI